MAIVASQLLACGGRSEANLDVLVEVPAARGEVRWTTTFSTIGNDSVFALDTDSGRNIYLGGAAQPDAIAQSNDAWTLALDPAGEERWEEILNGASNGSDMTFDVVVTTEGHLATVTATEQQGVYGTLLRFFGADGTVISSSFLPSNSPTAIAALSGGDVVVVGSRTTSVVQPWIARYGATGEQRWSNVIGSLGTTMIDVGVDEQDRIFVTATDDGNPGSRQVAAVDGQGSLTGEPVETCGARLAVSRDGQVTLLAADGDGSFNQGTLNLRMCRHDASLATLWSRGESRAGDYIGVGGVDIDRWGQLVAVGFQYSDPEASEIEMWTRKYDSEGGLLWDDAIRTTELNPDAAFAYGTAITVDGDGSVISAGLVLGSNGNYATVVRKLSP